MDQITFEEKLNEYPDACVYEYTDHWITKDENEQTFSMTDDEYLLQIQDKFLELPSQKLEFE